LAVPSGEQDKLMISHVDAVDGVVDERLAMIALAFWLDRSH